MEASNRPIVIGAAVVGALLLISACYIIFSGDGTPKSVVPQPANPSNAGPPAARDQGPVENTREGIDRLVEVGGLPDPGVVHQTPATRPRQVSFNIPIFSFDDRLGGKEQKNWIGYLERGNWLRYSDFDFGKGDFDRFVMRTQCAKEWAGHNVIVRIDSPTGTEIARVKSLATPAGTINAMWQGGPVTQKPKGVHDLYITFDGGGMNLFSFKFIRAGRPATEMLKAIEFDDAVSVAELQDQVSGFGQKSFLRYPGIQFTDDIKIVAIEIGVPPGFAGRLVQFRLDSADGQVIAEIKTQPGRNEMDFIWQTANLSAAVSGAHDVYLTARGGEMVGRLKRLTFYKNLPPSTSN